MKIRSFVTAVVAALGVAGTAHAALLEGNTVSYQYLYPDLASNYGNASNGNYVVGAGVEVSNVADSVATLDISDTNLYVRYVQSSLWNPAAFNGFVLSDALGTIDAFTGVTINAATNLAGLDASRITFDDDHIWVNWQGLVFDPNTVVSLDIAAGTVPEPGSAVLAGLGLAGLARSLRRKTV